MMMLKEQTPEQLSCDDVKEQTPEQLTCDDVKEQAPEKAVIYWGLLKDPKYTLENEFLKMSTLPRRPRWVLVH